MAITIAIRILGKALTILYKKISSDVILETIYLSKLKIIKLQKNEPKILINKDSKIMESAKKDDIKANIEVKKIVAPILAYLIISNFGHFEIKSRLTPEQKRKNLVMISIS